MKLNRGHIYAVRVDSKLFAGTGVRVPESRQLPGTVELGPGKADAIAQLNKLNDPVAIAKRGKLMLPPPQVTPRPTSPWARQAAQARLIE